MQTTKLDPTLKRIGGKLREGATDIIKEPLPSRMTDLLARLSNHAPITPAEVKSVGQITKKR